MKMHNNFNDTESLIILEHQRYMDSQNKKSDKTNDINRSLNKKSSQATFSIRKKIKTDDSYDIINDLYRISQDNIILVHSNYIYRIKNYIKSKILSFFPNSDKSNIRK